MSEILEKKLENTNAVANVLLMEDEPSVAEGLEMILKEEGYHVDMAGTGQAALELMDRNDVDLLVADLRLPDMNGMDVIKNVRKTRPDAGVIVITGYASVPSAVEAMKAGVVDYLPKPFTEQEFMARVERALGRRKPLAEKSMEAPEETEGPEVEAGAGEAAPHVLVVEDDPSVALGLETALKENGCAVDLVHTGKDALDILGRKEVDLLVADLRLPDMNGMEVIRKAKGKEPRPEVIVVTGYSNVSSAVEAMRSGAADYLSKPFTEEEFVARVDRVLKGKIHTLPRGGRGFVGPDARGEIRIGFYLCRGGTDISDKIKMDDLLAFARKQPGVAAVGNHKYLCRSPELEMIEKDVREFSLNRVIVAGCNQKAPEKLFKEAFELSGLKAENFHMVPLREQVAWVSEDIQEATGKARSLVAAAIHRAKYRRTLKPREVRVHPDVLVVGGGIAGMQAALDIASSGHKAYLVEKQPAIGGHMLQFDKTFPTLDCAACIGTPKMTAVGQDPNIELLTCSEVKEISGFVGNYKVKILRKPRFVREDLCTGCGECATVCPVSKPSEWDEGLGLRKAIYRSFPQAVPITYVIDKEDRAPCTITCPAGINVQGYVQLIGQGKYKEALQLIMERLPLPGVLGRVCPHPCESECRRLEKDEAVAIRDLKRFAADRVNLEDLPIPEIQERPEKAAVIGSGPAGLSVAFYLRLKGYGVRIYEALPVLGGMLRVGIPDYRLPQEVLDREIAHILRHGIEARTGQALGKDFALHDLEKEGFKAVFLAVGAHRSIKAGIPGEGEYRGVLDAVDFLREANLGRGKSPGNRVVILGGGNVAIDAARVARRLGAGKVHIVYRRSREEMPAYPEEVEAALEEGIEISFLTAPLGIIGEEGKVTGLTCIKTALGEPDRSGRRRPVPVEGSEFVIPCDALIPAIGQAAEAGWARDAGLKISGWGTFEVNPHTMQTNMPHVFAAGDAVTGPATVIEAVAGAHRAVEYMDRFLKGEALSLYVEQARVAPSPGQDWAEIPANPVTQDRWGSRSRHRDPEERVVSFEEVDHGLSEDEARQEALRCLNCGVCSECMECVKVCEAKAIDHSMGPEEREIEVGSIILATGYDLMDPSSMVQFGYGKHPNVLTSLEFERLNNATGPTAGRILMRDRSGAFTEPPQSVAIIHCVGSRDRNYHTYCSRVCCMYALKYGHLLKDKLGHQTRVYDFYIDMRCFGRGYEEFYRRCQDEGIIFFRGKPSEITDQPESPKEEGKLIVVGEDTLMNRTYRIPVDMAVLCPAMEARKDSMETAGIFGISRGADGFFSEVDAKLAPLNTGTAGIFLAGACQGPKDIPDTVAQASGAAGRALSLAVLGKVQIPATIAWIDADACRGCRACIKACEHSAIDFDANHEVSVVNQAVCKGCGTCVTQCPNGAARLWQFAEEQIFTELDAMEETRRAAGA